jgi:hypothetical protein
MNPLPGRTGHRKGDTLVAPPEHSGQFSATGVSPLRVLTIACPEGRQPFPGNKTKLLPAAGVSQGIAGPETGIKGRAGGLVSGSGVGAGFLALALLNHNCGWPQVIREPFMQSCKPPGAGFTPREQTEKVTSYAYPKKS